MKKQFSTALAGLAMIVGSANVSHAKSTFDGLVVGARVPDSVRPGGTATFTTMVLRKGEGRLDVTLSCVGLPAGVTSSANPAVVTFTGRTPTNKNSQIVVTTAPSTAPGIYPFQIIALDKKSGTAFTNNATLNVVAEVSLAGATLSITPSSVSDLVQQGIVCNGAAGQTYVLEATESLSNPNWTAIATNTADVYGMCLFADADAYKYPARFYRAATVNGSSSIISQQGATK